MIRKWTLLILPLFFLFNSYVTVASVNPGNPELYDEVALNFRYGATINHYVIALYDGQQFMMPVSEIFTLLRIVHEVDVEARRIRGYLVDENRPFVFDFRNLTIRYSNREWRASVDDMYIGELDFYISQRQLQEIFGLEFIVDFTSLTMRLVSDEKMPVLLIQERVFRREMMLRARDEDPNYPLLHPRKRRLSNGAFLDYSINTGYSESFTYSQNMTMGGELLGGDLQGTHTLFSSEFGTSNDFTNVRWRFVRPQSNVLSQVFLGEMSSDGSVSQPYVGLKLTNDRVLPRRTFDTFRYTARVQPQSEVEIYINNRLVEFIVANEFGDFVTDIPLTFGTSDIRIVSIAPSGEINEVTRRLQVPFTFLPQNEFVYYVNAGRYERLIFPGNQWSGLYQASGAYGLTRSITLKTGLDIIEQDDFETIWYNQLNFRLFDQYLLSAEIAPGKYYRSSGSVIYANGMSINISGTEFTGDGLYNRSQLSRSVNSQVFLPFYQYRVPFGLRYGFDYIDFRNGSTTRHLIETNVRVGRINLRSGFRQSITDRVTSRTVTSRILSSATYTLSRSYNVPSYLRGTFVRAQAEYDIQTSGLETADLQLSRQVWRKGRMDVSYNRNFRAGFNVYQFGFTWDFNFARSSSRVRSRGTDFTATHNLRGSVGYDVPNRYLYTDFRQQVGRSGVAFRMFVDENANGRFDEGELILNDPAVRVRRGSTSRIGNDDIIRFTQLMQYERYHVEINKGAIRNPLLVPLETVFSLETDPNQFKMIEIPFYYSGVIEGSVFFSDGETKRGLGGARLYIESKKTGQRTEVRTFADGSYYAMEIEPGFHTVYPDSNQLNILSAVSMPGWIEIEVQATPDGDFLSGLDFVVSRKPMVQPVIEQPIVQPDPVLPPPPYVPGEFFRIQTAIMQTLARAVMVKVEAEEKTNVPFEIQYSQRSGRYRIFSREIEGMAETLRVLEILRGTQFRDAYVIDDNNYETTDLYYSVQIGAFNVEANAHKRAAEARDVYGFGSEIVFDAVTGWYLVLMEQSDNWLEASDFRNYLRSQTRYRNAFVRTMPYVTASDYEFIVQVAAMKDLSNAYRISSQLARAGIKNFIYDHPRTGLYSVRIRATRSMEGAFNIRRQLIDLGYEDPLILTIRK